MRQMNHRLILRSALGAALALLLVLGPVRTGPAEAHDLHWTKGQVIYIPAYAFVRIHGKKQTLPLTTTLFVHNTSQESGLTITSLEHHDARGALIRSYAPQPVWLGPLATFDVLVEEPKEKQGGGSCFVLTWTAEKPISPPIAESVMTGTGGQQGISYRSPGQVIRELK